MTLFSQQWFLLQKYFIHVKQMGKKNVVWVCECASVCASSPVHAIYNRGSHGDIVTDKTDKFI